MRWITELMLRRCWLRVKEIVGPEQDCTELGASKGHPIRLEVTHMGMLINLIILLCIFAVVYIIIQKIPVPPEMGWIVQVVLLVVFLLAMISVLSGSFSIYPFGGTRLR